MRARVQLHLPGTQELTKSLKNTVGFARKDIIFEMTKPSIYMQMKYFKIDRSMNVNCYCIVYFSVKSFYQHF